MKATKADIEKILATLTELPRRIAAATAGIDDARLHLRAYKNVWSASDVLAHIRSCADVWGGSIESMLMEEYPTLPDIHPRQWIKETNYSELNFRESLKAFSSQRVKLLKTLSKLSFEDWSRGSMIGGRKHTVFSQARRMAKHESEHCEHIKSMLKG